MDIDEYRHPEAIRLDELIRRGSPLREISSLVSNLRLADIEPVCMGSMFIDQLFQPDFVMACNKEGCLLPFAALVPFIPRGVLGALSRHSKLKQFKNVNETFWSSVNRCADSSACRKERVPRDVRLHDDEIDSRVFDGSVSGFDWVFDINYRRRDCVPRLKKSRWRFRLLQLDVFRSLSDVDAWLLLQVLPSLPLNLRNRLARQAFIGMFGEQNKRMDFLRQSLWRILDGDVLTCWNYLGNCVSSLVKREHVDICFGDDFGPVRLQEVDFPTSQALTRFESCDSVEEMKLGETISGCRVRVGNLCRFINQQKVRLCCHYLPLLASDISRGFVNTMVRVILREWPDEHAVKVLPLIESCFQGHLRNMRDSYGNNLLCNSIWHNRVRYDVMKKLVELGCDPDERCLAGYTWNEAKRYGGYE